MFKMRYFSNKFSKIAKRWELSAPSASLPFDIGDLKLRHLVKLWCFKLIMAKLNFRTFQWRHHNYVTKKKHQNNVTKIFYFGPSQSKFMAMLVDKSNFNCNFILSIKSNYIVIVIEKI